jgi:hypothetical protein
MTIEQFTPRERTEGDSYKPSEHIGALMIVKVKEAKFIESTLHKPEGGNAVVVDVHDLQYNQTFHDVLWMNGAIVDELNLWVRKIVVIKFAWTKAQKAGGMDYIVVVPADANEMAQAQARMNQGDPFAVQLQTPGGQQGGQQQQGYAPPPQQGYQQQQQYQQGAPPPAQYQQAPPPQQYQQAPPPQQDPWAAPPSGDQPPF